MFLKTAGEVPRGDHDLLNLLIQNNVQGYSESTARRKNARPNNMSRGDAAASAGGKKKKHRSYVQTSMRTTNAHLAGTKIGEALQRSVINARRAQQEETARQGRK